MTQRSYLVADGRLLTPGEKTFFDRRWIGCTLVTGESTFARIESIVAAYLPALPGPAAALAAPPRTRTKEREAWRLARSRLPYHFWHSCCVDRQTKERENESTRVVSDAYLLSSEGQLNGESLSCASTGQQRTVACFSSPVTDACERENDASCHRSSYVNA